MCQASHITFSRFHVAIRNHMTLEYWALFQNDTRPTRIVVKSWDEMKQQLDVLVYQRGPLVWLIR